ncbi:receptor like 42-like [Olea europaea subsp. europaea]|uniref:Receptor like 42-like n=1 Tax=Olea europaea subsp. europaea TaxID=158383 RepID=A0A8S0S8V0_OLEEU|nr:receptor like 42-like [Olea europaea subsp. europaea]
MKNGIGCIEEEKEALLKFKDELIDEDGQLSSWGNEKYKRDCCKWSGVNCDNQTYHIVELDLYDMHLRGNISVSLLEIQYLKYLDLTYNDFHYSRIPHFIGSLGKEAEYINTLELVKLIDLSSNNLVGDVPMEITNLVMLVGLNFSRNNLFGFLHANIEQLRSLDFLDFSRNHFSGGIPNGVSQLDQLGVLDLSYNSLSGKIPQSIHLRTFNAFAFEENPGLCGLPLTKACPEDEIVQVPKIGYNFDGMKDQEEDKLINDGFYISMAIGFIFGFWGVCGTFMLNHSWRIAFFKLWNSIMDWLYVKIAINKIRLREAYHKSVKF